MVNYVLSCKSTVDLTRERLERRGIPYIRYSYGLGGAPCRDRGAVLLGQPPDGLSETQETVCQILRNKRS